MDIIIGFDRMAIDNAIEETVKSAQKRRWQQCQKNLVLCLTFLLDKHEQINVIYNMRRSTADVWQAWSINMGGFPSGQRGQTVNLLLHDFDGPNPSPPTKKRLEYENAQAVFISFIYHFFIQYEIPGNYCAYGKHFGQQILNMQ